MDFDAYIQKVVEHARARKRAQGSDFNELDFFMGAGVVFDFLGAMDQLPAAWVFGPLAGKDILECYEAIENADA